MRAATLGWQRDADLSHDGQIPLAFTIAPAAFRRAIPLAAAREFFLAVAAGDFETLAGRVRAGIAGIEIAG